MNFGQPNRKAALARLAGIAVITATVGVFLCLGSGSASAHSSRVFTFSSSDSGRTVSVSVGDELDVHLNPAGDTTSSDSRVLARLPVATTPGITVFRFRAVSGGTARITGQFVLPPPSNCPTPAPNFSGCDPVGPGTFALTVRVVAVVQPPPTGSGTGYAVGGLLVILGLALVTATAIRWCRAGESNPHGPAPNGF